jgi:non-homologous end joining protein Ku
MPRASWRGYLRLSLVSCLIYLSPATARTNPWARRRAIARNVGGRSPRRGLPRS